MLIDVILFRQSLDEITMTRFNDALASFAGRVREAFVDDFGEGSGRLEDSRLWLTLCGTTIRRGHSEKALSDEQQKWIEARVFNFIEHGNW
jgi:hypothetical protein